MNTLFLVTEALADYAGVSKKILAQVNALETLGMKVALSYLKINDQNTFTGRYINDTIIDKYSRIPGISKIQYRCKYQNLYRYIRQNEIKLVFIRYTHFANPFFISFLKKLKKNGIIILLEIPTYPYDQEYQNLKFGSKIALSIEKFYRRKFKDCVTRIITLSNDTNIFGVPAIPISNGIDPASINMIQKHTPENEIHLIGVASMGYWHGYDRVIEGLLNYYRDGKPNKRKVFFHVIGDSSGTESLQYQKLIRTHNLGAYVTFYGKRSGKELDTFFNRADIAAGTLGGHRIGIKYIKSLKNREYCARGIPFFYSQTDPDFEDKDFIYKVPSNDDPIDIYQIVSFVVNNKFDPEKIRKFAIENLTWDKQFEKILQDVINDFKAYPKSKVQYESSK